MSKLKERAVRLDPLSPLERSERMSLVRSKDTKPELMVRRLAHSMGYRYRLHRHDLPGIPDLVFPSRRKVIFVHGCFWHRHKECPRCRMPKSRLEFWRPKLENNAKRDKKVRQELQKMGWKIMVIWECQTEKTAKTEKMIRDFLESR